MGKSRSRITDELMAEEEWELPTSMIDVVFLLLIFFMCASKFRIIERRLDAFLPKDKGPSQVTKTQQKIDEITIKVKGAVDSPKLPQFTIGKWSTGNATELAEHLEQLRSIEEVPVVIDGAQNCYFRHVMTALDCCARASLTKVEFRPPPLEGAPGT
jgi:biopolymer transport protein ExbD